MYLVDTSVWIDFLKGNTLNQVQYLKELLKNRTPIGITTLIYQEILQGARTEADFQRFSLYFGNQLFYHPRELIASSQAAARLYFTCRRNGITIRSTVDCLIAQIAIEHNLILLHNDRDFTSMAEIVPQLKIYHPVDEFK
jgi:predicted nucleic acid-binding protein